ncbi:MAG: transporter [Planctomycetota bacterium]|nr:MAG: transporter [Planctomycetota bacterium]
MDLPYVWSRTSLAGCLREFSLVAAHWIGLAAFLASAVAHPAAAQSDSGTGHGPDQASGVVLAAHSFRGFRSISLQSESGQPAQESLSPPDDQQSVAPDERYGEAPPEVGPQFLRSLTPLLRRGQSQFDYGLVYTLQEFDFPTLVGSNLVRANSRRRALFTPLAWRYGWNDCTQLFVNLPVGWSHSEVSTPFSDNRRDEFGIGDLTFGVTKLWRQNRSTGSSTIVTFRTVAPTGDAVNPLVIDSVGLGSGAWRFGGDLLRVQSLDPVVLFYGIGYVYSVEDSYQGNDIQLGHQANYNLGVGFAANEYVTLSTAFLGAFITETRLNGVNVSGSEQEPLRVRMAATIARRCRIIEPFVTMGLTDTAPSAELGVVWTR